MSRDDTDSDSLLGFELLIDGITCKSKAGISWSINMTQAIENIDLSLDGVVYIVVLCRELVACYQTLLASFWRSSKRSKEHTVLRVHIANVCFERTVVYPVDSGLRPVIRTMWLFDRQVNLELSCVSFSQTAVRKQEVRYPVGLASRFRNYECHCIKQTILADSLLNWQGLDEIDDTLDEDCRIETLRELELRFTKSEQGAYIL